MKTVTFENFERAVLYGTTGKKDNKPFYDAIMNLLRLERTLLIDSFVPQLKSLGNSDKVIKNIYALFSI